MPGARNVEPASAAPRCGARGLTSFAGGLGFASHAGGLVEFLAAEFGQEVPHPTRLDSSFLTWHQATGGRSAMVTRIPDEP